MLHEKFADFAEEVKVEFNFASAEGSARALRCSVTPVTIQSVLTLANVVCGSALHVPALGRCTTFAALVTVTTNT